MAKELTKEDYMRMAIEQMKLCKSEKRIDGKVTPFVGAVLVKPDRTVVTAYRGELREGDHAEFTAIERKSRDQLLEGSTIYATLEPCAPGARKSPKLSCSERIVNARIKKVYIGISDPDPTVAGKGVTFLEQNGIQTEFFPMDMQAEISEHNAAFLKQAEERAFEAKTEEDKTIYLSEIEKKVLHADLGDLNEQLLNTFKQKCHIVGELRSNGVLKQLTQFGLFEVVDGKYIPTGLAILLFGNNPQMLYPHAVIRATFTRNGKEKVSTFEGRLIDQPRQVEGWYTDHVESWIDRSHFKRKDVYAYPLEAIREIVTNAIVHRDYTIEGAPIYIQIDEDKIVVKSPGRPIAPVTLAQMVSFTAPSLSRNPKIIFAMDKFDLAEQRGMGFRTVRSLPDKYGLPLPEVNWEDPYLVVTMPLAYMNKAKNEDGLHEQEQKGLDLVRMTGLISKAEYATKLSLNEKTAERHLKHLCELGKIEKVGKGYNTRYKPIILTEE